MSELLSRRTGPLSYRSLLTSAGSFINQADIVDRAVRTPVTILFNRMLLLCFWRKMSLFEGH